MNNSYENEDLFQTAHPVVLFVYTLFSLALIGVSLLMGWERWPLILIAAAIVLCWFLHITQIVSDTIRLWIYSMLMMVNFFFYGIHSTSTYDLAVIMSALLFILTLTGIPHLITLGVVTYYITFGYDIFVYLSSGSAVDRLFIARTLVHAVLIHVIGIIAITVMRTWDRVLRRSDEKIASLTESTRTMNDFLVNMSHEIRTPINAVMGLSRVCIEKEEDDDIRQNMVSVERAGKRVAEQISDILDYSEINMENLVINNDDYMLSSVLNDLVTQIKPLKPDELELVIDVDPGLPSVICGDAGKLKKILWHLIMNGLKYSKEGGVYVHLYSVVRAYGINLCIDVRDTGIGMSPRELERVYEGFYQANSGRTRSTSGLGLGMSIVYGFVTAMKGFVTMESEAGEGTSVHISIPQKVTDPSVCMKANNNEKLILGTFLRFEKFSNPNVREYYNAMILDIVTGLKVQMHRVETLEKLQTLVDSVKMTHLFVGDVEYEENREYMEKLAQKMLVVVVANDDFIPQPHSHVRILRKPFYCFPVIRVLNSDIHTKETGAHRLFCRGVRALVVDDELMNLTVAKGIFSRYGMTVECARSGKESIKLCKEKVFDIVFMDHLMHEMDGVEAMKRIRVETGRRELPIVALTANAVSAAKEMFLSEGFDGFVSKPVELEELESVLRKVLPKSMITYEEVESTPVAEPVKKDKDLEEPKEHKNAAATESEKETEGIDKDALTSLGIDAATGLHYCQEDEEFYKTILEQFYMDSARKIEDASVYRKEKDYSNYSIVVHALKSTAKMIGALELSEKAKALEDAAKNEDGAYIDKNHQKAMEECMVLSEGIKKACGFENADEGGQSSSDEDEELLEFMPDEGGEKQ